MEEKIYLITAINSIIEGNKNNKIDLGNYELEYLILKGGFSPNDFDYIDALVIQTKLKNKESNKIEYTQEFYKPLRDYTIDDIFNLTISEKMDYILRKETLITRKKYLKDTLLTKSEFYDDLKEYTDDQGFEHVIMPKRLTAKAKEEILLYLKTTLSMLGQELELTNLPKVK